MADLDDFFAKKDRKKSKSTKKFSTTDEVAKKLEDHAKKAEKLKKERQPESDENVPEATDQDEWKDFEEEKKDYSGLKIGNLTISSQGDENRGQNEGNLEQQDGMDGESGQEDRKTGPWKRIDVEIQEQEQPPPPAVVEKKSEQQPITKSGAYVPPYLRNQSQQPQLPSRLKTTTAPDIHNEEFFPTLSKTNDHKKNRNEGTFEVVHNRGGSHRLVEQAKLNSGQGPKLALENRYNTLSDS